MVEFQEDDIRAWYGKDLPAGYEWRCVDFIEGEWHFFAPDGRDLSEIYDDGERYW